MANQRGALATFVVRIFTWWNGATIGTLLTTWRKGEAVGEDEFGNRYYRERGGDRRWVVYNGLAEPTKIPPGWHAWMHHTVDTPPATGKYKAPGWAKPYQPNFTGTPLAYRPKGSLLTGQQRPRVRSDYEPWSP